MTRAICPHMTHMNTEQSHSPMTLRGRKRKSLTMEEWKELHEWHIYILYRQAIDF